MKLGNKEKLLLAVNSLIQNENVIIHAYQHRAARLIFSTTQLLQQNIKGNFPYMIFPFSSIPFYTVHDALFRWNERG
jgi:hypothetical protein